VNGKGSEMFEMNEQYTVRRARAQAGPLGGIASRRRTVHIAASGPHRYHADIEGCHSRDAGRAYFAVDVVDAGLPRRLTLLAPGGFRTFRACRDCGPRARSGWLRRSQPAPRQGMALLAWKPWI
jgi:hypothetical protein